jgi:predicted  nucleic acid-binding Zn-ribbon protein
MKKLIMCVIILGISLSSSTTLAGVCSTKPEAESKTETLPVKYKKLRAENEELKEKLQSCMEEKETVRMEISSLESEINQLETTKVELQNKLRSYPSKEELLMRIQNLENDLRRE